MGLWFPAVPLAAGEQVRYKKVANSFKGMRSIGGQVTLTDRRLIFAPNRLDVLTGAKRREMSVDEIQSTQVLSPGLEGFEQRGLATSIRPQIEITNRTGSSLIVSVIDPDSLYELLPH